MENVIQSKNVDERKKDYSKQESEKELCYEQELTLPHLAQILRSVS